MRGMKREREANRKERIVGIALSVSIKKKKKNLSNIPASRGTNRISSVFSIIRNFRSPPPFLCHLLLPVIWRVHERTPLFEKTTIGKWEGEGRRTRFHFIFRHIVPSLGWKRRTTRQEGATRGWAKRRG